MKEALEILEEMRVYCNNFVHPSCDYSIYSDLIDFIDSATSDIEAQEAKSCEWKYNEGEIINDEEWVGQCGAAWSFFDGTPKENGMDFCPKCGGKLIEKATK